MKKAIDSFLRFFLFGNVYVSLCAVALTYASYQRLALATDWAVLGVVWFGTLAVYNFDRIAPAAKGGMHLSARREWIAQNEKSLWEVVAVSLLGAGICAFGLSWRSLFFLGHLGLISGLYAVPLFPRRRFPSLKSVPGLKNLLISYVWMSSTMILPLIEARQIARPAFAWGAARFVLVFLATLPFDIRDVRDDREKGYFTLPVLLGTAGVKWLASGLWLLLAAGNLLSAEYRLFIWPATAAGLFALPVIWASNEDRPEWYFSFLAESILMLAAGLHLFFF